MTSTETNIIPPQERILVAASELFYVQGIRATGIDGVISKSGVAKASFYKHFPSKDALIVAFLNRRDGIWREWLRESVERLSPAPAGRPLAIFDALVERFSSEDFRGCAFINSIVELANRDHAAHIAANDHKQQVTSYIAGLLELAGVSNPDSLAQEFIILIDGAVVTALREGRPDAGLSAKRVASILLQEATKV